MRRAPGTLGLAGALGVAALVFAGGPVGAGEASGCSWKAISYASDPAQAPGQTAKDVAQGPGAGATASDPLDVDVHGVIAYSGTTDRVIQNGTWEVKTFGLISVPFSGAVRNSKGDLDYSGVEPLAPHLVKKVPLFGKVAVVQGLIHVEFTATGANGATCTASGYLRVGGSSFLKSPQAVAASVLVLGGLVLAFFAGPTGVASAGAAAPVAPTPVPTAAPGPAAARTAETEPSETESSGVKGEE